MRLTYVTQTYSVVCVHVRLMFQIVKKHWSLGGMLAHDVLEWQNEAEGRQCGCGCYEEADRGQRVRKQQGGRQVH